MKWDKALTYLIIMFLCVNIGLAIGNYNKSVRTYRLSDRRKENITSVLKDNNVIVKTKMPTQFAPVSSIWVLPVEVTPSVRDDLVKKLISSDGEGVRITKEMSELPYEQATRVYTKDEKELKFSTNYVYYKDSSIEVSNSFMPANKAKDIANEFLKKVDMLKNTKKLKIEHRNESYGASMTYYEVYDNLPIFGSYIHMKIAEDGVFEVILHGNTVGDKAQNKKPIYPIDTVLFGLMDEVDTSEPIIIEDMTLGYAVPSSVEMHVLREEAVPMYKISIQGLNKPLFVNAYTNTVEDLPTGTFYK